MPIADMTGAAANRIGVANQDAALGRARNQQIVQGAGEVAGSLADAHARSQMTGYLTKAGYTPEEASVLARDPATAARALVQKKRDAEQRQQQVTDQGSQFAQQGAREGFTGGTMDPSGAWTPGAYSPGADPDLSRQTALAEANRAAADKTSRETGGEMSQLLAPTLSQESVDAMDPDSPAFDPAYGLRMGPPGAEGVASRAARKTTDGKDYRAEALAGAYKQVNEGANEGIRATKAAAGSSPKFDEQPITQEDLDAYGLDPKWLGRPRKDAREAFKQQAQTGRTAATVEGAGARTQATIEGANDRQEKSLKQQAAEFKERMAREDQRISLATEALKGKVPQNVMQELVNARQRARDAATNFDADGAKAEMDKADAILQKYGGGAAPAPAGAALTPEQARQKLLERHPEWNGKLPGEK